MIPVNTCLQIGHRITICTLFESIMKIEKWNRDKYEQPSIITVTLKIKQFQS